MRGGRDVLVLTSGSMTSTRDRGGWGWQRAGRRSRGVLGHGLHSLFHLILVHSREAVEGQRRGKFKSNPMVAGTLTAVLTAPLERQLNGGAHHLVKNAVSDW